MFERTGDLIDLGDALQELAEDQSTWSQQTFGLDAERGPIGALKHLQREAAEAIDADAESIREELADCFLLILDASRRSGMTPLMLVREASKKMAINKSRTWPTPKDDEPVEHIEPNEHIKAEKVMSTKTPQLKWKGPMLVEYAFPTEQDAEEAIRLFDAADDLLGVCKMVKQWIDLYDVPYDVEGAEHWVDKLHEAIDKAEAL